jgi:hypothetical protein
VAEEARELISAGKAGPHWYATLADWEYEYGSRERAVTLLEEGISKSSRTSTCYRALARILISEGKTTEAVKACPLWLPKDSFYYRWLASSEASAGRATKARHHYRVALNLLESERDTYRLQVLREFTGLPWPSHDGSEKPPETCNCRGNEELLAALERIDANYSAEVKQISEEMDALSK